MSNLEIIRKVAKETRLPFRACRRIVDLFWSTVADDLASKTGRARISGFGTFVRRLRKARVSTPPGAKGRETFTASHFAVVFRRAKKSGSRTRG